jgi:hypothetical protein
MAGQEWVPPVMYSPWDIMVRELGGGIWFWTSLWLVFAFVAYIARESINRGRPDSQVVLAAAALTIYFLGSMIRGFITWMQFFYAGNGWSPNPWVATWPWYGLSVLLNITGAAMCIWLLSSWRWRLCFTIFAVIGAVLVPSLLRWLV